MTASIQVNLPGFHAPAASFDQPFDMLGACHERVQRSLDLLKRLQAHLLTTGCDDDARQAAADVLRYFDIAAPLHHEDEELHVFPPLLANAGAEIKALVRELQQDHHLMESHWANARCVLKQVGESTGENGQALDPEQTAALHGFTALYNDHIEREEQVVYPAALVYVTPQAMQTMGADMKRRRGQAVPSAAADKPES